MGLNSGSMAYRVRNPTHLLKLRNSGGKSVDSCASGRRHTFRKHLLTCVRAANRGNRVHIGLASPLLGKTRIMLGTRWSFLNDATMLP